MNNNVKKIACLLLSALTVFSATACGGGGDSSSSESSSSSGGGVGPQTHNTETRPVVFSTDALDGNFNPFFATSATDSTIAAMTQVGMMTTDANGNPAYGVDQPTVTLDYKSTMYDSSNQPTDNAGLASKENGGYTVYEFIIKNGLKFSDGEPLTIKDVLFNLYVYLDPMYMGSATIYSTDIRGLKAYRMQDPLADENTVEGDALFYSSADTRITNMLEYLDPEDEKPALDTQVEKDIATVKKLFKEEAESDWNMVAGTLESYKEDYTFTEDWQLYYFNEGIIRVQTNPQGKPMKDDNDKYLTSLDDANNELAAEIAEVKSGVYTEGEFSLGYWIDKEGCTEEEAAELAVKAFCIDNVYTQNTMNDKALANVIRYWATGSNVREEFAAEARSEYFADKKGKVKSISGITTYKTSNDFDGDALGEEHDVLRVEINGVDPKAIWNFSFSVTPMHYYSNAETINDTENYPFGVRFSDKTFFDEVLQDSNKNGLPVGAGVYKASNEKGTGTVNRDNFYRNYRVYFERNEYFYTMLGDGMERPEADKKNNAKIKYLQYRVIGSDKIMQALQAGSIDFGAPQAKKETIGELSGDSYKHLAYKDYKTNGYGYVGINPTFVPDIEVRQAIMKAMNPNPIVSTYYGAGWAEIIHRSMSTESWAYPEEVGGVDDLVYDKVRYTTDNEEIEALVRSAGWSKNGDGIFEKDGEPLELTFTIAGESVDHPAYQMFLDAAEVLNECGFDVSVTTDITALKKLATGGLAVWAAAWNSSIDPDLYQVYHKDSKATSIKNWGYSTILNDKTTQFNDEKDIIDLLSQKIEEGRMYLNEKKRAEIYAECLDLIMELAVELPTYQRKDLVVYNRTVINGDTLNQNPTANAGVYDRLWEVNYL